MRIILGVTGCIGAYKSATILRLLQKEGFEIHPVMTRHARKFITPLTLEKLSGQQVISDLFDDHGTQIEHIALARRSDLLLVAPATANVLGKFAHGVADDFLSTLYLSTTTPVVVAPAMNVEMWNHPATQANLQILKDRGVIVLEPGSGYLACGEEGEGRLAEPEQILDAVLRTLSAAKFLLGKRVLVTAGPTVEDIDPVRFLSNRSSGRMGYAMAREAQLRGARVSLVTGPTHLQAPQGIDVVPVRSAQEMARAVFERFEASDVVIMAAAVSDFAPLEASSRKIKKEEARPELELKRTVDILEELGRKKTRQLLVGFAAESDDLPERAKKKLREKGLDLVIGNDVFQADGGFQSEFNQVVVVEKGGQTQELPRLTKTNLARVLWEKIEALLESRGQERVETRSKVEQ